MLHKKGKNNLLVIYFSQQYRVLVHLSRGGADVSIYAPDINQMHVIDHTKGEPTEETR